MAIRRTIADQGRFGWTNVRWRAAWLEETPKRYSRVVPPTTQSLYEQSITPIRLNNDAGKDRGRHNHTVANPAAFTRAG
jgi:hypothetical protein